MLIKGGSKFSYSFTILKSGSSLENRAKILASDLEAFSQLFMLCSDPNSKFKEGMKMLQAGIQLLQ